MNQVSALKEKIRSQQTQDAAAESSFDETLSPELFFAMAPNFDDSEFVRQAAPVFLGRSFQPSEFEFHRNELASLRMARNEFLSILRFSAEGKANTQQFNSPVLVFWRCYRFLLKAIHRIPKFGPKICRLLEIPRWLLVISRLPRRLEELEQEMKSLKRLRSTERN